MKRSHLNAATVQRPTLVCLLGADSRLAVNDEPEPLALVDQAPEFVIGGRRYDLESMLAANGEDPEICAWLRSAVPGDVYDRMHSELVKCVARIAA